MRWRSAEVILEEAGAIVSIGGAFASGAGLTDGETLAAGVDCGCGVGDPSRKLTKLVADDVVFPRVPTEVPNVRLYLTIKSTTRSRAFSVYPGISFAKLALCSEIVGTSHPIKPARNRKPKANKRTTALVRLRLPLHIRVTT